MISINATLVVQIVNFLVLIWILNNLLFKPIFKIIEEREQSVEESKSEIKRLRTQAEHKTRTIEAEMSRARKVAAKRKEEVRGQAAAQAEDIMGRARAKAQEHISAIETEAENQANVVRQSLDEYKDAIVEMVLLKVMGRKVV